MEWRLDHGVEVVAIEASDVLVVTQGGLSFLSNAVCWRWRIHLCVWLGATSIEDASAAISESSEAVTNSVSMVHPNLAVGARTDADSNLQTTTSPRCQTGIIVLIFLRLVATYPANG